MISVTKVYFSEDGFEPVETRHGIDLLFDEEEQQEYERERAVRVRAATELAIRLLASEMWNGRPKKRTFVHILLTLLNQPDDLRMFVESTYSNADGEFVDRWIQEYVQERFGVTVSNVTIANVWLELKSIAGDIHGSRTTD